MMAEEAEEILAFTCLRGGYLSKPSCHRQASGRCVGAVLAEHNYERAVVVAGG